MSEGLKPQKLLTGIVVHVLKDVAIAPTFRSGIKNPPKTKGFSPLFNKAVNLCNISIRQDVRKQAIRCVVNVEPLVIHVQVDVRHAPAANS